MTITDNRQTRIGEATIAEFAAGLRGTAVRPGDEDYDRERSIWNGAHDRRPAVIARAAGVADVIRTVDLARSEGLPLAVRGGGHSIAGFSTVDDGIVLDLSGMRGIQVDPEHRRVSAQAGCTWKDLDAETQQFGLAVTGGLLIGLGVLVSLGITLWNRVFKMGRTGQSVGKKAIGLFLLDDKTGRPIGAGMCFLRELVQGLVNQIFYLGWLWMLWDTDKQTLGDKSVHSSVVVVPKG